MSDPQGCSPEALDLDPGVAPGSLSLEDAVFVGVDWGSTRVRAWLFGPNGTLLDTRLGEAAPAHHDVLGRLIAGWPSRPVLACGMVGARGGWVEAPYAEAPASLEDIAATAVQAPGESWVRIVGGVAVRGGDGRLIDVMRGEETLVLGLSLTGSARIILPGTHSKWVEAEPAGIRGVQTFLTGDLFAALRGHTVLARSLAAPKAALGPGLEDGLQDGLEGRLTESLFRLRVADLDGRGDPTSAWRRLSGLLIGDELRCGLAASSEAPLVLVADSPLAQVYRSGLALAGIPAVRQVSADSAARQGLQRLWRQLSC